MTRQSIFTDGSHWRKLSSNQCDASIQIDWRVSDGDAVEADSVLCEVQGPARAVLTAERCALNFLQTLSGTATLTREYADKVKNSGCRILDTRKTLPQLRLAQKYAVRCGGGSNHRIGLFDAYLIKENHLAACGGIVNAVKRARELNPDKLLEVEVENLDQLRQAMDAGVERVLLDNFSLADMRRAVEVAAGSMELEASGNIDLGNIAEVAATGVNYISIGALTKNLHAIDFSLRYR